MLFTLALVCFTAFAVYLYMIIREKQRYFEKIGVPFKKPTFLLGSAWKFMVRLQTIVDFQYEVYNEFPNEKLVGLYQGTIPGLFVRDPELVVSVLIKDFSNFHDRGSPINEEVNPLEGHLFNLSGSKWRALRNKLSPTFTSGKIKSMLRLMDKCVDAFIDDLDNHLGQPIEVKNQFLKLAAHVIGSCTFGIETDSIRNENSDFIRLGMKIIQPDIKDFIPMMLRFFFPFLDSVFKFKTVPKEVNDFFFGLVKETMDYRKKTGYVRNDFVQLLLELREKGEIDMSQDTESSKAETQAHGTPTDHHDKLLLTDSVLTAQATLFLAAGFETTSTALGYLSYELSKNIDVQEKLREEIRSAKAKYGEFTYDSVKSLEYLDAVINETLRLWPPVPLLFRECTQRTQLGGVTVEKGMLINIPVAAIQKDPRYFPDPETFKPERFLEDRRHNYAFLPFGDGPRNCIGERFARLELKITIARLLDKYRIDTCERMAAVEPIKFKHGTIIILPRDGIHCVFNKID